MNAFTSQNNAYLYLHVERGMAHNGYDFASIVKHEDGISPFSGRGWEVTWSRAGALRGKIKTMEKQRKKFSSSQSWVLRLITLALDGTLMSN